MALSLSCYFVLSYVAYSYQVHFAQICSYHTKICSLPFPTNGLNCCNNANVRM